MSQRCKYCKLSSPASDLYVSPNGRVIFHRSCAAAYRRRLKEQKKETDETVWRGLRARLRDAAKDRAKNYSR